MGLDNFWVDGEDVTFEKSLCLIGGMMSSNGGGSFRGKCYDSIIFELTGKSLYEERLSNNDVQEIANVLDNTSYRGAANCSEWNLRRFEFRDLKRMFRIYADAGASLVSWF